MANIIYYISSALNILRFRRKLPDKPDNWEGPFRSRRQAQEMKDFIIQTQQAKKQEKMKINRGG